VNRDQIIAIEQKVMANVYAKRPVVIVKGSGDLLWDKDGKEYIDCTGSYGSCIVGYCHPKVVEAIKNQSEKLTSCHGFMYNEPRSELLQRIAKMVPEGLDRVFLSNSGAEAVECALKLARKYTGKKEIIAMMGAYHGKTLGALSATWDKKYRDPFMPLIPQVKHVPFGNIGKLKEIISTDTAAVITEPIQGEGGVRFPPNGFLEQLRELCNEKGILLIIDEIQTGFGRTGRLFAFQHYGIVPDITCLAKGVAGGIPIGLTLAKNEIMSSLKVGEHSTTYGGNPIACAAAAATIDILEQENLPEKAHAQGEYLVSKLNQLRDDHAIIREVRGLGLVIGVEMRFEVLDIILRSLERGVLMLDAGRNVLRFLPPLVITRAHIDRAVEILDEVIGEKESGRLRDKSPEEHA
jgi:acetylornithine/LysW-gamma-L-lysine aminotransferase